jgi:hypothetical protein
MSKRKIGMSPVLGMPYQGTGGVKADEDVYKRLAEAILDPMTYEKLRFEMTTSELKALAKSRGLNVSHLPQGRKFKPAIVGLLWKDICNK